MELPQHHQNLKRIADLRSKAVADMRRAKMTWQQIGDALGVTRQRAQQIGARIR